MSEAFNELEYLAMYPDVATAVRTGQFNNGLEHFKRYGKSEGRASHLTDSTTRVDKTLYALDKKGAGLEVGPSHNPIAPKSKGFNVHILDYLDTEELRAKFQGHGVNLDNIEDVDFVWNGEPLSELIGRSSCYDWIIASHVIEHIPDPITFFQQCEILLKPTGKLSLIIPDKRYCFDYFNPVTTTGELLDAYVEKRTRPTPGQLFNHVSNASTKDGAYAWHQAAAGELELRYSFSQASDLWRQSQESTTYYDAHCWRFTPVNFRLILSDLHRLGLVNLTIVREFGTTGCEFFVTLGKEVSQTPDRLDLLKRRMPEFS